MGKHSPGRHRMTRTTVIGTGAGTLAVAALLAALETTVPGGSVGSVAVSPLSTVFGSPAGASSDAAGPLLIPSIGVVAPDFDDPFLSLAAAASHSLALGSSTESSAAALLPGLSTSSAAPITASAADTGTPPDVATVETTQETTQETITPDTTTAGATSLDTTTPGATSLDTTTPGTITLGISTP